MLVGDVEAVKPIELLVSGFVRLRLLDDLERRVLDAIYGLRKTPMKVRLRLSDREARRCRPVPAIGGHELPDRQIECGSCIVDDVTDDRG
jgi:hypothetical protein